MKPTPQRGRPPYTDPKDPTARQTNTRRTDEEERNKKESRARNKTPVRAGGGKTETLWEEIGKQKPTKGSGRKYRTQTNSITEESEPEQSRDDLHTGESLDSLRPEELEVLETSEMEEDLSAMRLRFPDFPLVKPTDYHVDNQLEAMQEQDQQSVDATWDTISWYPGYRRIARLKEKWLEKQRPPSYCKENELHGEGSGKAFLEAHRYEILDGDIEEKDDRLPLSNKPPQNPEGFDKLATQIRKEINNPAAGASANACPSILPRACETNAMAVALAFLVY
ncbi:MAG: hypothetical protein M1839_008006 [Geoglossum umbratile]|nr:MAG: hypothetical protein M1839_008006 [Geoglossum umbratile]